MTPTPAAETGDAVSVELRWIPATAMACLLPLSGCSATATATATGSIPSQGVSHAESMSGQQAAPASHLFGALTRLDRIRTEAYASSDPGLLRSVYAPGSTALRHDRRTMRAYAEGEITLRGVRLDLLAVRLVDRGSDWVRLRVVDRLRRPIARLPSGTAVLLPQDQPTRWLIELRRDGPRWRIATVRRLAG